MASKPGLWQLLQQQQGMCLCAYMCACVRQSHQPSWKRCVDPVLFPAFTYNSCGGVSTHPAFVYRSDPPHSDNCSYSTSLGISERKKKIMFLDQIALAQVSPSPPPMHAEMSLWLHAATLPFRETDANGEPASAQLLAPSPARVIPLPGASSWTW